jgi:predicted Zn finger-like uncharacterized protein
MSLITRCPACGTMFKVVPDQLRISEGWVRCGHCSDIFDAAAHLHNELNTEPGALEVPPSSAAAPAPTPEPEPEFESESQSEDFPSSLNTEIGNGASIDAPDSAQLEEEARALAEDPRDRPFELRRQDGAIVETAPSRLESDAEALHDVSFVREAQRKAFWTRRPVRGALVAAVLLLAALLLLQVAIQDRDRLAETNPGLRPWLARMCEPLNCRISPPRQIDAIAIESSSFNKLRADAYRLNVTLRNQAQQAVALPALELTLTDAQDQAVVRRVLTPSEFGAAPVVMAAAAEWSGSLTVAVAATGGGRIAGYRLLAFYP